MNNEFLVVESWLISATEYIAIDNTPLWPRIHVDGRSGLVRLDQSAGYAKLKSQQPFFCYLFFKNKYCFILYVFVAIGAVARVNWVIPAVLPEYLNYVSLA